jgi:ribonuclease HI
MAKLQATWLTGPTQAPWAGRWTAADGEIVFDDNVRCVPSTSPIRFLGVMIDSDWSFHTHVANLLADCERYLRLLAAMATIVKAEKLKILYRGLILSRLLFAADAWFPYVSAEDRRQLQSLHYRACCVITGCPPGSHAVSVCYEAGFRMFDETVRDETVKLADKLRRVPDGCASRHVTEVCFGPQWVARLFRDGAMPTAELRPVVLINGATRQRAPASWPPPDWRRADHLDSRFGDALRDVGMTLAHGGPARRRTGRDARVDYELLRPLPRPHPWAPHELRVFDDRVRFFSSSPGGLVKPKNFDELSDAQKAPFARANAQRMSELAQIYGADAMYVFVDAARVEERGGACAGAFVISAGADPRSPKARRGAGEVPASPIACTYTGELLTLSEALAWVLQHIIKLFGVTAPRNLVVVTDSKSALESVRTTWLRRIGRLEQDVARHLFELASLDVNVGLAFVFAHAGGVPGNDYVDKRAVDARARAGREWSCELWHVDTTRHILTTRHRGVDATAGDTSGGKAFRFRHIPIAIGHRPSDVLPRDMPRDHETLVFRARLGMLTAAGGLRHDQDDACPLCGDLALGRDGKTLLHLEHCLRRYTTNLPVQIDTAALWNEPAKAAKQLALARAVVADTPLGRERAALRRRGVTSRA